MQLAGLKLIPDDAKPPAQGPKYAVRIPSIADAVDVDIIKLTAQYVARNGRAFLSGLTSREQGNPQFDFLNPGSPLFSFFQRLVEAYAQVIIPPKAVLDQLRSRVKDSAPILRGMLLKARDERARRENEARNRGEENEEEYEEDEQRRRRTKTKTKRITRG